MDLKAEAVAGGVEECPGQAMLAEDVAGGPVDPGGAFAGAGKGDSGLLGLEDGLVELADPRGGRAAVEDAGHVAGVAAVNCAAVDEDDVLCFQLIRSGPGVGEGGVWSKGDDGIEGGSFRAEFTHPVDQLRGDVYFGDPGPQEGEGLFERLAGDEGGLADEADLRGGLDGAQGFDEPLGREQAEAVRKLFIELAELSVGQMVLLDAEAAEASTPDPVRGMGDQRPAHGADAAGSLHLALKKKTRIGQKDGLRRIQQKEGIITCETSEIADVGQGGDEEGAEIEASGGGQGPLLAAYEDSAGGGQGFKRSLPVVARPSRSR